MKILIDECIPRKFKNSLTGHECRTVPEAGLAGGKNGELLSIAEHQGFDIFLIMDKGVEYELNLNERRIAIIVLHAPSNRLIDLRPHAATCLERIRSIKPREIVHVG